MRLNAIAAAITAATAHNHSILIYGPPKSGKTRFVGTAAELEEIDRIFWFDLENGWETLANMGLSDTAASKIELIRICDTRRNPVAIETMLLALCGGKAVKICEEHGKVDCAECRRAQKPFVSFDLSKCTHRDLVVIDSGSQLGNSALSAACLGKDITFKPTFDEYGLMRYWLTDILSVVQQCQTTNFVLITHELIDEEEHNGRKSDKIFPLVGTRSFCREVAKYFGTVAYFHLKLGKHVAGSTSTYRTDALTGSRVGANLEKSKELNMRDILIAGGVLRSSESVVDTTETPPAESPVAPVSVKDRIAAMRKT